MRETHPNADREKIVIHIDPDLEAIVPGFLANRQRDLKTIESCLQQRDFSTVRLLGHRMKGDGGGYGFDQISMLGHHLEEAALAQDLVEMQYYHEELRTYLARIAVVYTR